MRVMTQHTRFSHHGFRMISLAIHVADWDLPVHGSNHRINSVSEPLPHRRLHQGQKRVVVAPYKRQ